MRNADESWTLDYGERAAVIIMTVIASLSTASVSILLLHIVSIRTAWKKHANSGERVFLTKQLGTFITCLLFSDFCQGIGAIIQGRWASTMVVEPGISCTAQGVFLMFGDVGTAVWNAVVAIHTFTSIVLRVRMSTLCVIIIVALGWCIAGFLTLLGPVILYKPELGPFYGVASEWCFIREAYGIDRVMVHHVPMLSSGFLILILYLTVFLCLRGYIAVEGWKVYVHYSPSKLRTKLGNPAQVQNSEIKAISKKVLWYPVVYITLILPISVCRFLTLSPGAPTLPSGAWLASTCILFLMGLANSIIYTATRRIGPSPLFNRRSEAPQPNRVRVQVERITQDDSPSHSTFTLSKTLDYSRADTSDGLAYDEKPKLYHGSRSKMADKFGINDSSLRSKGSKDELTIEEQMEFAPAPPPRARSGATSPELHAEQRWSSHPYVPDPRWSNPYPYIVDDSTLIGHEHWDQKHDQWDHRHQGPAP